VNPADTHARLQPGGWLVFQDRRLRTAIGRAGVRVHKEEGDGATPAALLPLRRVLYRADRVAKPAGRLLAEPIAPNDGWCDESGNEAYNQQITLPHSARHEELWRRDHLYDVIVVLGWNDQPVMRSRGSAIFLHVAQGDFAPTEGCLAMPLPDLQWLLAAGCQTIDTTP
jgi:L,D-peptidoglycan transpeptidase YkuD (ErfK/YbiS/YcfS/YnhG family)